MSSHNLNDCGDESMAQSRQAGMGDSLLTDSQTKGVNKRCAKPPIVMKLAVKPAGARLSDHMLLAGPGGMCQRKQERGLDEEKTAFCRSPAVNRGRMQ
jgi:hypothetical protein